jgi:chemotaxis protein methyltransferase CheR
MREKEDYLKYTSYWQVISETTGYDFSGYSSESMNRKLANFISSESIGSADELRDRIYTDGSTQEKFFKRLLTNYTEMFRDPEFFLSLKNKVLPYLSTYPKICIWHAGCSTGEEVYSLAILLDELNLLNRCEIIATDINELNLQNATSGIFPLHRMQESATRYYRAGGSKNLSSYYTAYYEHIIFHQSLRDHIHFKTHDIVIDKPFKNLHLILCRNVFIYFNFELQQKVLRSMCSNLINYGYLGLGLQEQFVDVKSHDLTLIDRNNNIFRKVI